MPSWNDIKDKLADLKHSDTLTTHRSAVIKVALSSVAILVAAIVLIPRFMGGSPSSASVTSTRLVMDAETGRIYENFRVPKDESLPWKSPSSGKRTLYIPEKCYWTADGKAKNTPDYVLLNEYTGKEGPTLCPVCSKEVRSRNPMPPEELLLAAFKEGR